MKNLSVFSFQSKLALAVTTSTIAFAAPMSFADVDTQQNENLKQALTSGSTHFDFRYRLENVSEDNTNEEALASTLKSRMNYKSGNYYGLNLFVELDNVSVLGEENHNDSQNGMGDHSKVIDPEGSEVNQAWVSYTGIEGFEFKQGRQRLNLDNQRFVGGVAWRQNEQTYDASQLIVTAIPDVTLNYTYMRNINDIKEGDLDTESNIFNVSYKGLPIGKLSAYYYGLDFSTKTTGVRFAGKSDLGSVKALYELEFASQTEFDSSTPEVEANYSHLMAGVSVSGVTVKLGQEVLGSDNGTIAFQTPLATKHKFNGWADKFLGTPVTGLQDNYVSAVTNIAGVKVAATYHNFSSDFDSTNYGSELDLVVAKKFNKDISLLLKVANYTAEDFSTDTTKVWAQTQFKF